MRLGRKIKVTVIAWLAAEMATLAIAVHIWGWPLTLMAGFLTSALGVYVLRKAGHEGVSALKKSLDMTSGVGIEVASGGMLRILSGLLLIIPGFVSDLAGLLLLAPFVGKRVTTRFTPPAGQRPSQNGVVDLDPNEWRAGQWQDRGPSCEPLPGMLPGGPKAAHSRRQDDE